MRRVKVDARTGKTTRRLKTKRAAVKRFKVTAGGKVIRSHSHSQHILTKKTSKRKRKLAKRALVSVAEVKTVRRMLLA